MRAWLLRNGIVGVGIFFVVFGVAAGCDDVANKTYCDGTAAYACTDPSKPVCDVGKKTCVAGIVEGDMGGDGSIDTDMPPGDGGVPDMVPGPDLAPMCTASLQCTVAGAPICGSDGVCRACDGSGDDALCVAKGEHVCITAGVNDGQCGDCDPVQADVENATCTSAKDPGGPICNAAGECVKCTAHAQCNSKVCDFVTGDCVSPSLIAYVNNFGLASSADDCIDDLHDSAPPNAPYCQVAAAINVSGKNIVSVAGSVTAYDPVTITNLNKTLSIVGPGAGATPTARIFGAAANGSSNSFDVAIPSNATAGGELNLHGVEVGGTDATRTFNALRCDDASATHTIHVNVTDSLIGFATQNGISSASCNLTVTKSTVRDNSNYGISADKSTIAVTDSTIAKSKRAFEISDCPTTITSSVLIDQTEKGIDAEGTGLLTVTKSTIHNCAENGIDTEDNVELVLTQSTLTRNGTALEFDIAKYSVENCLIARNTTAGINFSNKQPDAASKIWFSTVIRNGPNGFAGGIFCGSQSRAIRYSVAALNSLSETNPTQFSGACAFDTVVAGTAETATTTGLIKTAPEYIEPNPPLLSTAEVLRAAFMLKTTDTAAKDQLDAMDTFPVADLFGTTRPQGPKVDIGAQEVLP